MRPMIRVVLAALNKYVRAGNLRITTAQGRTYSLGDGTGRPVALRFTRRAAERAVIFDPELKLGECYMDGTLLVEEGSIADALKILLGQSTRPPSWARPRYWLRYARMLSRLNWRSRARRNVAHHYDLDGRLYSLFLDGDRQYSCAYFESPGQSLDDAQLAKRRHLAAKLLLRSGQRVLDIGCGWGGLALYFAETCGSRVTGITLSQEQLAVAHTRAAERGLAEATEFRLHDYRQVRDRFDRIVSVGMFEHVGVAFYDKFFRKCSAALEDDGIMLLHAIGRSEGPGITNPWIAKYIFPGGYIPALSEVLPAIERSAFLITDIEILRLHYAETLKAWRERFLAHRDEVMRFYDERFLRMWEFYLAASEIAFREQALMVFQIQMTKRQGIVPNTRDYIGHETARLRALEGGRRQSLRLAGE
jgi:cyclopropane-fatty-acyl-phospholipid synthase